MAADTPSLPSVVGRGQGIVISASVLNLETGGINVSASLQGFQALNATWIFALGLKPPIICDPCPSRSMQDLFRGKILMTTGSAKIQLGLQRQWDHFSEQIPIASQHCRPESVVLMLQPHNGQVPLVLT